MLEQYLDNPSGVPSEWRVLFDSAPEPCSRRSPGSRAARAARGKRRQRECRNSRARAAAHLRPPLVRGPAAPARRTTSYLGGVAAAMSLIKAHRTHGHLAATSTRSARAAGDPALEPERLIPKLTPS